MPKDVSAVSHRAIEGQHIQFKDGKLFIWGIPGAIFSNYAFAYQFGVLNKLNLKEAIDAVYWMGFHQAYGASIVIHKKFGIEKKAIENVVGQGDMLGQGKMYIKRMDMKKGHFMFEAKVSIAEEYRAVFGISKKPLCHHLRGLFAGLSSYFAKQECVGFEKQCIAQGAKSCLFEVKPKKGLKPTAEEKAVIPADFPKPEDLGDKSKILK